MNSEFIRTIDLFSDSDDETCASLLSASEPLLLEEGELLIQAGSKGTDLFLLESGRLDVFLNDGSGVEKVVRSMYPGQTVGEISLMTGVYRSASVKAATASKLYCITRERFDRIAQGRPGFREKVERVILSKMHAANLSAALYRSQLFGQLNTDILKDLQREIVLVPLKKGDQLIAQNEPSDSLYLVVSGQLRVFEEAIKSQPGSSDVDSSQNEAGEPKMKPIVDIGRGQTVGEIGFLTGEPRGASVYALRDNLVGRLVPGSYFSLLQKYPEELTRLFSSKLLGNGVTSEKKRNRTFALIGINTHNADYSLPIDDLAKRLCWHIENPWSLHAEPARQKITTEYINEKITGRLMGESDIAEAPIDSTAHLHLQSWFAEMEQDNEYLLYGANYSQGSEFAERPGNLPHGTVSNWLSRISQQVDHIIFVADASIDPSSIEFPNLFDNQAHALPLNPSCSLMLLHPEECKMPSRTCDWLDRLAVDSHHHVRWSQSADSSCNDTVTSDIGRVSRLLINQGVGLVLSGGAARGFAHIGVVRALHEAGVPIDLFGGSSAGAISASIIASGHTDDQAHDLVIKHGRRQSMNDFTLPLTSLFRGESFSALLRRFVGKICIEDLWNPLYCVSINMADASEVVHRRGPLWKYVRASASMPIMLPPVTDAGRLLVDGAMLNAMPVEIMRSDPGCSVVIGIDVSGGTGMRGEYSYGTELSGWQQLLRKLNPLAKPYRSPRLSSTILAISAIGAVGRLPSQRANSDLYIRPPVHKFQMMDYDSREQIMQAGYEAAKTEVAAWLRHKGSVD